MFKNILIPLDGTKLAESVLPLVEYLAGKSGSKITLIHIIEHNAPSEIHGEHHLSLPDEATRYLNGLKNRLPASLEIDCHVHSIEVGKVAPSISEHAIEFNCDLIIMCAHGHKRIEQKIFGSISQQVINYGRVPVLVTDPKAVMRDDYFTNKRILVPLDGNEEHERGLYFAKIFARLTGSTLYLLMVVYTYEVLPGTKATTSRFIPGTTSYLLDLEEENAEKYIGNLTNTVRQEGYDVMFEVRRGDPVKIIVQTSQRIGADMIVMGTHGRVGSDAFWSGSITARIFDNTNIPLLLAPI